MRRLSLAERQALEQAAQAAQLLVPAVPDSTSRAAEIGVLSDLGTLFAHQHDYMLGEPSDEDAIDDLMISIFDESTTHIDFGTLYGTES